MHLPVPLEHLSSRQRTSRASKQGEHSEDQDDWRALKPAKRCGFKWKGHTDFFLTVDAA